MSPAVSIIMPTFNRLEFLEAAIASVLEQTFEDWELIIADDGSSEPTRAYLQALQIHRRIHVILMPHTGRPSLVSNVALRQARGEYVAFLDSDDVWLPTKLEIQIASLRRHPERGWSYTKFALIDSLGHPTDPARTRNWPTPTGWILKKLLVEETVIAQPSVIVMRRLLTELGAFDEELVMCYDDELWFRLAAHSEIDGVDEPLTLVRRHAQHSGSDVIAWRDRRRVFEKALAGKHRSLLRRDVAQAARPDVGRSGKKPGGLRKAVGRVRHALFECTAFLGAPAVLAWRMRCHSTRGRTAVRTHTCAPIPAPSPACSLMSLLAELWSVLTPPQRRRVIGAQVISVAMALSTVTGIAAIAPFFAVLGDPRLIDQNRLLHWLYVAAGFSSGHAFAVALGFGFIGVVLLANLVNAIGGVAMNRLALRIGAELQAALFGEYLRRPYAFHATTHSTTLFNNIVHETARVTNGILQSGLALVTNVIAAACVVLSVLLLNTAVSLTMLMGLAGGYAVIYLCARSRLLRLGQEQSRAWSEQTKIVNESFGAIREILLLPDPRLFYEAFEAGEPRRG